MLLLPFKVLSNTSSLEFKIYFLKLIGIHKCYSISSYSGALTVSRIPDTVKNTTIISSVLKILKFITMPTTLN